MSNERDNLPGVTYQGEERRSASCGATIGVDSDGAVDIKDESCEFNRMTAAGYEVRGHCPLNDYEVYCSDNDLCPGTLVGTR